MLAHATDGAEEHTCSDEGQGSGTGEMVWGVSQIRGVHGGWGVAKGVGCRIVCRERYIAVDSHAQN